MIARTVRRASLGVFFSLGVAQLAIEGLSWTLGFPITSCASCGIIMLAALIGALVGAAFEEV